MMVDVRRSELLLLLMVLIGFVSGAVVVFVAGDVDVIVVVVVVGDFNVAPVTFSAHHYFFGSYRSG